MQCRLPLSSLNFNLPARPQAEQVGERTARNLTQEVSGQKVHRLAGPASPRDHIKSLIFSNKLLLLGETQEWEIPT